MTKRFSAREARALSTMLRESDRRTADGKRRREGRREPRREGTRAAIVRAALREV